MNAYTTKKFGDALILMQDGEEIAYRGYTGPQKGKWFTMQGTRLNAREFCVAAKKAIKDAG